MRVCLLDRNCVYGSFLHRRSVKVFPDPFLQRWSVSHGFTNSGFLRVKFQSDDSGYKFIFHGEMELGRNAFNQIHNLLGKYVFCNSNEYIYIYIYHALHVDTISFLLRPCSFSMSLIPAEEKKSFKRGSFITQNYIFFCWLSVFKLWTCRWSISTHQHYTSDCNVVGCILNICFQQFEGNSMGIKSVII